MKKSFHWFFYSYALVDQDIPLCTMITPSVPDLWNTEVQQGDAAHTPPSMVPDVVVFSDRALWDSHKSLDAWCLQLQAAAFIHTFRTALHDTKAATQTQSRKGRPVPAAFVPFHNNWDSCDSIHTNSFLYFALSPPVSFRNPIYSVMSSLIMQWLTVNT